MDTQEKTKTALGIALLFTIVTSAFSLLAKLGSLIVAKTSNAGPTNPIKSFITSNLLWLIVTVIIIVLIVIYLKKSSQNVFSEILQNEYICLTAGILIALQGLISLAGILPTYIANIQTVLKISAMSRSAAISAKWHMKSYILSAITTICQILLGIYLAKHNTKKTN